MWNASLRIEERKKEKEREKERERESSDARKRGRKCGHEDQRGVLGRF